jgi:hypothetical protein
MTVWTTADDFYLQKIGIELKPDHEAFQRGRELVKQAETNDGLVTETQAWELVGLILLAFILVGGIVGLIIAQVWIAWHVTGILSLLLGSFVVAWLTGRWLR